MKMRTSATGSSAPRKSSRHPFSLIELVVVLAIIGLISGIAVGNLRKTGGDADLRKTSYELESLFVHAARMASVQGKIVSVVFDSEERMFRIADENSRSIDHLTGNQRYLMDNFHCLRLPENIDVSFDAMPKGYRHIGSQENHQLLNGGSWVEISKYYWQINPAFYDYLLPVYRSSKVIW